MGNQIANVSTVVDGLIVLGGGVAAAHKWFMPALLKEMNGTLARYDNGGTVPRTPAKAYDLSDPQQAEQFYQGGTTLVKIPHSNKQAVYNKDKKVGIALSKLGTSRAVAIGAYSFALKRNRQEKNGRANESVSFKIPPDFQTNHLGAAISCVITCTRPWRRKNTGESWELSAVKGNVSVAKNGPLAGKDLDFLCKHFWAGTAG